MTHANHCHLGIRSRGCVNRDHDLITINHAALFRSKNGFFFKNGVIKCSIYIHIYISYLMFFSHNIERDRELKLDGFCQGHSCLIHHTFLTENELKYLRD